MARCNCAGSSCSCQITPGNGIKVSGTGSANDPFVITADLAGISIGDSFAVSNSTSIEFGKRGTGAVGDPVVFTGQVVVRSPDQTRWTLAVSNAGVLSAVPAGPSPTGSTGTGGVTVVQNEILYWDGSVWESRTSSAHAVWNSLGYTGVPVPGGFKKNDTWLCEAT